MAVGIGPRLSAATVKKLLIRRKIHANNCDVNYFYIPVLKTYRGLKVTKIKKLSFVSFIF